MRPTLMIISHDVELREAAQATQSGATGEEPPPALSPALHVRGHHRKAAGVGKRRAEQIRNDFVVVLVVITGEQTPATPPPWPVVGGIACRDALARP
jgi:hypothetical protein